MSHHESTAKGPDGRMVDRMLFFSDAVFAIVLTIMVLELHAPVFGEGGAMRATDSGIWHALASQFHIFFAYFVSFIIVGLWWSIHMRVTRALHVFDWPAAIVNFAFLLTVTLIPFAASVLGGAVTAGAAWVLYWGVNAASSTALTVLMIVVTRDKGRLIGGIGARERLSRVIQGIGPAIGFAAGAWAAGSGHLEVSRWCWLLIMPIGIVARLINRAPKPEPVQD
jgi:uncharacterized membrane protein